MAAKRYNNLSKSDTFCVTTIIFKIRSLFVPQNQQSYFAQRVNIRIFFAPISIIILLYGS